MAKLHATFITMFKEPIATWLNTSIIGRAHQTGVLSSQVSSILEHLSYNHHAADDTPYGGGPGELLRIDVIEPLIAQALLKHQQIKRAQKRVVLMDPAGMLFSQSHAKRLASYNELIFISGRYEGFDARIHHYVDEAISLGDFVLSSGDCAAMAIFDATARMIEGVLGNKESAILESHMQGRLEASLYTRPKVYNDHAVPEIFCAGNHRAIKEAHISESLYKTSLLRPDLLHQYPLTNQEKIWLDEAKKNPAQYPWMKSHE